MQGFAFLQPTQTALHSLATSGVDDFWITGSKQQFSAGLKCLPVVAEAGFIGWSDSSLPIGTRPWATTLYPRWAYKTSQGCLKPIRVVSSNRPICSADPHLVAPTRKDESRHSGRYFFRQRAFCVSIYYHACELYEFALSGNCHQARPILPLLGLGYQSVGLPEMRVCLASVDLKNRRLPVPRPQFLTEGDLP